LFQSLVPAFDYAFSTIPHSWLITFSFALGAFAQIRSRLRIEENLYQAIRLACPMDVCGVTSVICNALAGSLEVTTEDDTDRTGGASLAQAWEVYSKAPFFHRKIL
jgi:hypothetical protein